MCQYIIPVLLINPNHFASDVNQFQMNDIIITDYRLNTIRGRAHIQSVSPQIESTLGARREHLREWIHRISIDPVKYESVSADSISVSHLVSRCSARNLYKNDAIETRKRHFSNDVPNQLRCNDANELRTSSMTTDREKVFACRSFG